MSAKAIPAISAAAGPNERRTVAHRIRAVATPARACGRRMANGLSPRARTESAIAHSETGGLSTVMNPAASMAP